MSDAQLPIEIEFRGRLTLDECVAINELIQARAQILAGSGSQKKRSAWRNPAGWIAVLALVPLFIFAGAVDWFEGVLQIVLNGLVIALIVFLGFLVYNKFFGRKRRLKQMWERLTDDQLAVAGVVMPQQLVVQRKHERVETQWPAFRDFLTENGVLILTYAGGNAQFLLRKWFAGSEDWQAVVDIIRNHLPEVGVKEEDAPAAVCSVCDRPFPKREMLAFAGKWSCIPCKPQAVQKLKEGVD